MRYLLAGLLQVAGVFWLIHYAGSPDDYYAGSLSSGTTHWEHASSGGAAGFAVGAIVIASTIALVFLAMALVPRWRRGQSAVLAGVAYLISLYVGLFWLTIGH